MYIAQSSPNTKAVAHARPFVRFGIDTDSVFSILFSDPLHTWGDNLLAPQSFVRSVKHRDFTAPAILFGVVAHFALTRKVALIFSHCNGGCTAHAFRYALAE